MQQTPYFSAWHHVQAQDRILSRYWRDLKVQDTAAPGFAVHRPIAGNRLIPADMQKHFRMVVRLMLFLFKFSCPYISNSVRELAKVNDGSTKKLSSKCWELWSLCWILVSKRWNLSQSLIRKNNKVWDVYGYCDSNYAGDKDIRLSVSGFCVFIMGYLV